MRALFLFLPAVHTLLVGIKLAPAARTRATCIRSFAHQDGSAAAALKAELAVLLADAADRGMHAHEMQPAQSLAGAVPQAEQVKRVADELEPLDPSWNEGWMRSAALDGSWRLRFTSSRVFHRNGGLTGYTVSYPGVSTPSLFMSIGPAAGRLVFTEPVQVDQPSTAGADPPTEVVAECAWSVGPNEALKIECQRYVAGDRMWAPRAGTGASDEVDFDADKAIRVLALTFPIFLDKELLILRGQVPDIVWVFERASS
jgi:hypothetical protein